MAGPKPTTIPKCRVCGTEDKKILCKGSHTVSGFINYCKPCKNEAAPFRPKVRRKKRKAKAPKPGGGKSFFDHHDIPCRNGCAATILVKMWPGKKPTKYHYCPACKNKDAGLSLQGIYN